MIDIDAATRAERPDGPRPRVVSVLSQKGGTGKTTLSCALAALATRADMATAVLDLDPQASAARWHDLRRANGEEDPPVFTTPSGLFRVRRKEKDPVWIAPDWYYVEKGLRVPSPDSPSRRIPGAMGTTAIYLGDGIAIHGTFSPGLILNPDPDSRRVSHGCIRLTNEAARDLYHLVEVGTPVLIY